MKNSMKLMRFGWLLAGALLLSACGLAAAKEPTPDIAAVQTEAVQQAMAQLTTEAELNPSATPVPPTLTPLPTATLISATATRSIASSGSSGGSGGSSGTPIPTHTPDAWKCAIVDEYPLDRPQMTGWIYDRHWIIKNTGTTTWWATDVYVEFDDSCTKCVNVASDDKFYINDNVEPGEEIDIFVNIKVPTSPIAFPGYTMAWDMISENGGLICEFWNNIPSTYPAPTKTPVP